MDIMNPTAPVASYDIMNPAAAAAPWKETSPGQAAIEEAKKSLAEFKVAAKPIKGQAEPIFQTAKTLIWAFHNHCAEGRQKLTDQEWMHSEYDRSLDEYRMLQGKDWEKVLQDTEALRVKVEVPHKLVQQAKEKLALARGEGSGTFGNVLGMGLGLTADQKMVGHEWSNHLKHEFDEAEKQYKELCGEPFGLLTKIGYLEKKRHMNLGIVPPTDL